MAKGTQSAPQDSQESEIIPVARNNRAHYKYEIFDKFEAGLVLQGTEVKSLREGQASINEAFARPREDELYLIGMTVPPYAFGNRMNHEPARPRKLLLRKVEIRRILERVAQKGFTLVPLRVYFRNGFAKVQIALCRGKQLHDRRESIKEREAKRDVAQAQAAGRRR